MDDPQLADAFERLPRSRAVPDHLTAFAFALVRANALNKEFVRSIRRYERVVRKKRKEDLPVSWVDGSEVVIFAELWFAALQVVVEAYERSHKFPDSLLSDPAVDTLLSQRHGDSDHRERLRRFRNTIFHPEFVSHPDVAAVLDDHEHFAEWAGQLTVEFSRLLYGKLKGS